MKPTDEDIRVLAYFEVEDRRRRGANIPDILARLASEAPERTTITNRTVFYGWCARVDGGQQALTLSGQQHLTNAITSPDAPLSA